MKTTIIIPAFNAARFLPLTLDSVFAQTKTQWDMIIVDDGSTDDTRAVACRAAARDSRIRVIHQANSGVSRARNRAFAAADPSAAFVVFLDADDLWEPTTLETLTQALSDHPDAVAAHGLAVAIDADGALIEPGLLEQHQQERYGLEDGSLTLWPLERPTTFAVEAVTERIITPGTVLIRRAALDGLCASEAHAGPFDPNISLWEDWDLWLRLTRRGDMRFVNQPVLRYRRHDANVSGNMRVLEAAAQRVRGKMIAGLRHDPQRLRIARLGARFHHRIIAARRLNWARGCAAERRPLAALKQLRHAAQHYLQSFR